MELYYDDTKASVGNLELKSQEGKRRLKNYFSQILGKKRNAWELTSNKREYIYENWVSLVFTLTFYVVKLTHHTGGEPVSCTGVLRLD